jgi:hypothetical protein
MDTRDSLEINDLPDKTTTAAEACGIRVRSELEFEPFRTGSETSRYDVCVDNEKLKEISRDFMSHFQPLIKVGLLQISILWTEC